MAVEGFGAGRRGRGRTGHEGARGGGRFRAIDVDGVVGAGEGGGREPATKEMTKRDAVRMVEGR